MLNIIQLKFLRSASGILVLSALLIIIFVMVFIDKDSGDRIDLGGEWELVNEKDLSTGLPDNNSRRITQRVFLPGNWNDVIMNSENHSAAVRLKKNVFIPLSYSNDRIVLSLGQIALCDMTYFNGILIGETGQMPDAQYPLKYGFAWRFVRSYYIPENLIRYNDYNEIDIRVYSHILNGFSDRPYLVQYGMWNRWQKFMDMFPVVYGIVHIFLNIIFYIIFLFLVSGPRKSEYIVSGGMLVSIAVILQFLYLGLPQMDDGLTRYKLISGLMISVIYLVYYILQDLPDTGNAKIKVILTVITFSILLLLAFAPDSGFYIKYCNPVFLVYVVFVGIYYIILFVMNLLKDPVRYWYLFIFTIAAIFIIANSFYYIFTCQIYKSSLWHLALVPLILLGKIFYSILDLEQAHASKDDTCQDLIERINEYDRRIRDSRKGRKKSEQNESIVRLRDYLDEHYREYYDRQALARLFNLHENYMIQLFKKHTGMSITSYINNKKISTAKELIAQTDSNIVDIAYHVGFDNLTYFYRQFKKLTGMTPSDYRESAR